MSGCSLPERLSAPECNYARPVTKKIWVRKNKNGQLQVKINGKGKWINAKYNEKNQTITYLS